MIQIPCIPALQFMLQQKQSAFDKLSSHYHRQVVIGAPAADVHSIAQQVIALITEIRALKAMLAKEMDACHPPPVHF